MAVFTWAPDTGASKVEKPAVTKISFGDGYQQRVAYGINTAPETWSVNFANRDATEAAAISTFLESQNGVTSFLWTPPNDSQKTFVCPTWNVTVNKGNLYSISATFEQVFE